MFVHCYLSSQRLLFILIANIQIDDLQAIFTKAFPASFATCVKQNKIKQNKEVKDECFLKQEIPKAVAMSHFRGPLFGSREWRCKHRNKLRKEKHSGGIHIPK